ncbi:MAG: hypothetical protein KDD64_09615 [Bdellovibrionales bacterium]|nr:hypothetical protein [Bdellovibrionales bacterium]
MSCRQTELFPLQFRCSLLLVVGVLLVGGCVGPQPGPDKQAEGMFRGAALGAGAGAVYGAQITAGTGPGAAAGAGLGAVAGAVRGFFQDQAEEDLLRLAASSQREREVAYAHEILAEHFRRRAELHPTRDIFPADLFFAGDEFTLRPGADALVREMVKLNKNRMPWSRLVIASYVKGDEPQSEDLSVSSKSYSYQLAFRRASALGNAFVKYGIEPRRIEGRVVIVDEPVVVDPNDRPDRFNQAVELIAADR